jgi:hypothetical protein
LFIWFFFSPHNLGKNGYAFATFQIAVEAILLLGEDETVSVGNGDGTKKKAEFSGLESASGNGSARHTT